MKRKYREYTRPGDISGISFYGVNRWQEIKHTRKEGDPYIVHYGRRYHLDEFMRVDNNHSFWKQALGMDVDGVYNDSYFSGAVIVLSRDGERAKIFTFIC